MEDLMLTSLGMIMVLWLLLYVKKLYLLMAYTEILRIK